MGRVEEVQVEEVGVVVVVGAVAVAVEEKKEEEGEEEKEGIDLSNRNVACPKRSLLELYASARSATPTLPPLLSSSPARAASFDGIPLPLFVVDVVDTCLFAFLLFCLHSRSLFLVFERLSWFV